MYDVGSTANVRAYKVSACAGTGEAANRLCPSIPSMESNSSSPTHRPAPGTPPKILPKSEFCGKCPDNLLSPEITKQKRISIKENPEVIKTVNNSIISRNKDQNAATIQTKTNDSIKENPHEQNVKKNPATIKHTLVPQRKRDQWTKPTPKSLPYQHPHGKHSSDPIKSNAKTEEKISTLQTKFTPSNKTKHSFQSMLKEKQNSWNDINESNSQTSEEEKQPNALNESLSKTNLSSETHEQEQPIYIFPPNIDYPEDDFHEFYYPSDFPKHSHLQIVCSYFRLGPPYGLLTASLEHYEHQKNYLDQRPLENNLKNNPHFMSLLTRYGDYYLDYDLQDPDNKASKQYLFINPHTKRISKRRSAATRGYH